MKISEEEYKKALMIVLEYESSLVNEAETILKRNNYTKPLKDLLSNRLMDQLNVSNIGINPNTLVIDFILMDICLYELLRKRKFGLKQRKELSAFLKEYQIK